MCFDKEKYARVDPETLEQKEKTLERERGEGNKKEKDKEEQEEKEEPGKEGDCFLTVKGR